MNPEKWDLFKRSLERGFKKAAGARDPNKFDLAPFVTCVMGPDIAKCREPVKQNLAFYIGGVGARDKKFYNDYPRRARYEEAAKKKQDPFFSRKGEEAVAAVPAQLAGEGAHGGHLGRA